MFRTSQRLVLFRHRQAAANHAAAAAVEGTAVARWTQGVACIDQAPGKATAARHVAPPFKELGVMAREHGDKLHSIQYDKYINI